MTQAEFLLHLQATRARFRWHIDDEGNIRTKGAKDKYGDEFCPIAAVAKHNQMFKDPKTSEIYPAADALKLPQSIADRIVAAADLDILLATTSEAKAIMRLRKKMLEVLGLKEPDTK